MYSVGIYFPHGGLGLLMCEFVIYRYTYHWHFLFLGSACKPHTSALYGNITKFFRFWQVKYMVFYRQILLLPISYCRADR